MSARGSNAKDLLRAARAGDLGIGPNLLAPPIRGVVPTNRLEVLQTWRGLARGLRGAILLGDTRIGLPVGLIYSRGATASSGR